MKKQTFINFTAIKSFW